MQFPRWIHRIYALGNGYFWRPCPICGKGFGGHESAETGLMTSLTSGVLVCRNCEAEAKHRNKEYLKIHLVMYQDWAYKPLDNPADSVV